MGAAFIICVNSIIKSVLSLLFPSILAKMSATGAFGFYAGLNMLAFVLIFFTVSETMQRSREEPVLTFGVAIHRHARYQVGTWLPSAVYFDQAGEVGAIV